MYAVEEELLEQEMAMKEVRKKGKASSENLFADLAAEEFMTEYADMLKKDVKPTTQTPRRRSAAQGKACVGKVECLDKAERCA